MLNNDGLITWVGERLMKS